MSPGSLEYGRPSEDLVMQSPPQCVAWEYTLHPAARWLAGNFLYIPLIPSARAAREHQVGKPWLSAHVNGGAALSAKGFSLSPWQTDR